MAGVMEPYQQLERSWAEWNGLDPAGMVACSSGTAALHLALEALCLPSGSEVIVPDLTMIACARAITLAGLTPVFVDCDDWLRIDADLAEQAIPKFGLAPTALMLVAVYGRVCSDSWINAALRRGVKIVEDLAEAHSVKPDDDSDAACWSFYSNKIVAGQEGGAVWFHDPEHAAMARQLRSLGFTDAHDFRHTPRGHNYRLSNANAELVLHCLKHGRTGYGFTDAVWNEMDQRRRIERWCDTSCPLEWRMPLRDAPWVYDLRIHGMTGGRQDAVIRALNAEGIAARYCFKPMSEQEEYKSCRVIGNGNAARLSREVVYIPLTPGAMDEMKIGRAFDIIKHQLT